MLYPVVSAEAVQDKLTAVIVTATLAKLVGVAGLFIGGATGKSTEKVTRLNSKRISSIIIKCLTPFIL